MTHANPVPDIEVTPEMVEAGLRVLEESGHLIGDRPSSADDLLIREVYIAI